MENTFNLKKYLTENKLIENEEESSLEWKDVANILQRALNDVNSHDPYAYANPEDVQQILNNLIEELSNTDNNL